MKRLKIPGFPATNTRNNIKPRSFSLIGANKWMKDNNSEMIVLTTSQQPSIKFSCIRIINILKTFVEFCFYPW